MRKQWNVLLRLFTSPFRTLGELPSTEFYPVALYTYLISRSPGIADLAIRVANKIAASNPSRSHIVVLLVALLFLALVFSGGFFLVAFIVMGVVQLFSKTLTYKKVLNIFGYTSFPMLISHLLKIALFGFPEPRRGEIPKGWTEGEYMAVGLFVGLPAVYGLIILVGGLIQAKDETRPT